MARKHATDLSTRHQLQLVAPRTARSTTSTVNIWPAGNITPCVEQSNRRRPPLPGMLEQFRRARYILPPSMIRQTSRPLGLHLKLLLILHGAHGTLCVWSAITGLYPPRFATNREQQPRARQIHTKLKRWGGVSWMPYCSG